MVFHMLPSASSVTPIEIWQDVMPSGVEGVRQPVHLLVLVAMGMPILDNVDLERLAEECAKRKRWDFLLTTAPLAVQGATGSALNPIAVF